MQPNQDGEWLEGHIPVDHTAQKVVSERRVDMTVTWRLYDSVGLKLCVWRRVQVGASELRTALTFERWNSDDV